VVLQPETWPISDDALMWNNQTWGKASTSVVPAVSKLKWLESRHLTNVENRWGRDRTDDFHYIFFNGHGYNAWENVWGIWNQLTPRAGETLRRIATIFRQFNHLLVSPHWEPYASTLNQGVFSSRFPGDVPLYGPSSIATNMLFKVISLKSIMMKRLYILMSGRGCNSIPEWNLARRLSTSILKPGDMGRSWQFHMRKTPKSL